jgi:hypothetical protein
MKMAQQCLTSNDLLFAFKRIRELEDYNFILNQKLVVYEYVLKFFLSLNSWIQCLLSYLLEDKTNVDFEFTLDILSLPNKMIELMKSNQESYQKKLDFELNPRGIKLDSTDNDFIDLLQLNEKFIYLNSSLKQRGKRKTSSMFSNEFLDDIDQLLEKHKIDVDKNKLLHSIDATKLVFSLLQDVFIRLPITITDFDPAKIIQSIDSLKSWIQLNYFKYSVNILDQSFFLNPSVYTVPFRTSLISSSEYMVKYERVMRRLIAIKRNEINVYTNKIDLNCFDKFFEFYKHRIDSLNLKDIGNGKLKFDNDLIDELLILTNTMLSLPNNKTAFDSIRQNYLVENWYLKRFLQVLLVSSNCDLDMKSNVFNPIRLLQSDYLK